MTFSKRNGMEVSPGQERIKDYLMLQFKLSGDQVDTMIPDFIDSLTDHLAHLESVLAHGDLSQLGKAAHTIKGALLNLGLHECAEIAYSIEQGAKDGDLRADYTDLVRVLHEKLANYLH
jgi:HPt (histidine-containing phosphotransfer) domain-containing protein